MGGNVKEIVCYFNYVFVNSRTKEKYFEYTLAGARFEGYSYSIRLGAELNNTTFYQKNGTYLL